MTIDAIKKKVGTQAAELIKEGMLVGLGTGSTAYFFIERLAEKCKDGLKIKAVASSKASFDQARDGGIPLVDINHLTHLDITVDGADKIDKKNRMIKGGGGALVREKIIASMSKEMVIIVDEGKLTDKLGRGKLPVELIHFAIRATKHHIEKLGFQGEWRVQEDGSPFVTDNGNIIFDIHISEPLDAPERVHDALMRLPGIVDTGFFFNLATTVLIGFSDGQVVTRGS